MGFPFFSKRNLGIDVGTSAIKIVELSSFGKKIKLENYLEIPTFPFHQRESHLKEKSIIFLPAEDIADAIKIGLSQAKISTKNCIFAIPDFLTFFTIFTLPPMSKEELEPAIKMEARKYIPVPLKEVTLDWQIIKKESLVPEQGVTVLVVAIPTEILYKYQKIATLSNLKLIALEAEVFGLIAPFLLKETKETVVIIDLGIKSTTCSIIEGGILKDYHSLNFSSNFITERLTWELGIPWNLAEKVKRVWGISNSSIKNEKLKEIYEKMLISIFNPLFEELERIFKNFSLKEEKEISKIVLGGGTCLMPGLLKAFEERFQKPIQIINPFEDIIVPEEVKEILKEKGPSFAIATGMAIKGLI